MKRIILHGFFACVYCNWTPLLVDLEMQHETHCTTWLFCTCILELNSCDGEFRCATWNALYYMAFLHVYTGIEFLWWWIYMCNRKRIALHSLFARVYLNWTPLLVNLEVQHEMLSTIWVFEACAVKGISWLESFRISFKILKSF